MMVGTAPGLALPSTVKADRMFPFWMKEVDAELLKLVGMDHQDLDDVAYWTWFDNGVGPKAAARAAIRIAKGDTGC